MRGTRQEDASEGTGEGVELSWEDGQSRGGGCGGSQPVPAWGGGRAQVGLTRAWGARLLCRGAPVERGAEALSSRGRLCRPFRSVPRGQRGPKGGLSTGSSLSGRQCDGGERGLCF